MKINNAILKFMNKTFSQILDFIFNIYGKKYASRNQVWLQRDLQSLMNSVDNVWPLQNCWGFNDGTLRPISRPSLYQEHVYSGRLTIFN